MIFQVETKKSFWVIHLFAEYMWVIKKVADELGIVGDPLSDDDLTIHVLNGLKSKYKEIISSVHARESPITFEELYDKLVDHKIDLKWGEAKQEAIQTFTAQNIHEHIMFFLLKMHSYTSTWEPTPVTKRVSIQIDLIVHSSNKIVI